MTASILFWSEFSISNALRLARNIRPKCCPVGASDLPIKVCTLCSSWNLSATGLVVAVAVAGVRATPGSQSWLPPLRRYGVGRGKPSIRERVTILPQVSQETIFILVSIETFEVTPVFGQWRGA